ncbi:MAG: hypothetical protein NWE93_05050 [Candidatus Bathyarchaeota archaeon]|nr:hypothetical protein [Candidatus Bathyarchaeota archaeon]
MPIKIVQSNDRVAEVQYFCDKCNRLVRTSIIPNQQAKKQDDTPIICYQCKAQADLNKES